MADYCFWLKIVSLLLFCALNLYLFILSCGCNYQDVVAREHIKFRQEMPTMDSWINSPFGKLKSYLFNVTNAEDFLSGKDSKVRFEEVGPITYHILGYNDIINRTKDSVTYNKHRYRHIKFMPEESVSPDILNKTIVQFNSVLLGAAAQTARSYISIATIGFDAVTVNEPLFLSDSIYYFLWEFTRPSLQVMSQFLPLSSNCGPLHNALKDKEEIFKVNIGTDHGVENFFRIQTLNDEQLIKEQSNRIFIDDSCPINVEGTHDNSLFPPNIKKNTSLNIVASESCRILPLHYQREQELDGINGYRYALLLPNETAPECLSVTNGVRLPKGMFDVSKCVINDAPAAFSMPHFYGSSYDWTEHFEGLNPNAEEHEGYILLEPTTGIPIKENYRFQSNTIMPNMRSYSQQRLKKLSYMIVPTFWYEFELDKLPGFVTFLIRLDVKVLPVLQPVFMALMLLGAAWSLYALIRLRRQLCHKICTTDVQLETVFNQHPQAHPTSENIKE